MKDELKDHLLDMQIKSLKHTKRAILELAAVNGNKLTSEELETIFNILLNSIDIRNEL